MHAPEGRDGESPDAPPTEHVERGVADDPVQPRPQRSLRVVLLPAIERAGERVVRRVDGRLGIAQDREGDPIDIVGVVAIGPLHGLPAMLAVVHGLSTSERRRSLHTLARPASAHAKSRPPSRTSSIQARSRPIVVAGPCPGKTATWSSRPRQPGDRLDHRGRVAARQVHPAPAAGEQRVAAEQEALVLAEQADRALRVARRVEDAQPDLAEPDDATLGQLDGGHGRRDVERRGQRLRVASAARGRAGGPRCRRRCASATAALSPMWSQWPWVETMSLSVQSRAASSSTIQASDGIAVSIAIASRLARVGQDVDVRRGGPDDPAEVLQRGRQASSLVFMQSKVWPIILLAVPSISRAPTLASVPDMFTSAVQSMTVVPSGAVREVHLGRRVDGAAGRLAVGLDQRPVGRLLLGEFHVDVEARADEPDADLGRGLEMGRVDDLDRLDAGAARADLFRVDDERPDLLAGRLDRHGAFEMHAGPPGSLAGRTGSVAR